MATPQPPPLTLAANQPYGVWECCTCITKYKNKLSIPGDEQRPWVTKKGDLVCRECIMPLFETAMKFDFEYPARWGGPDGIEMRIDDFTILWRDGVFPASYKAKGAQLKRDMLAAAMNPKEFIPDGLVVGKDVQPCPECKTPWGLKEGCNHMTCKTCNTSYCFICGKEALEKSGHWSNRQNGGSCPRWGRLDDESGIYDNEQEEEEVDWTAEISFETWAWNVAIQNASDHVLLLMQRMLGVPIPNVPQGGLNTRERRQVLLSMVHYRLEHRVSREFWAEIVAEHRHEAMAFMGGLNFFFEDNIDEDPILNGVLARPIGGVFNLSSDSARRGAYEWAQQAYNAWTPATQEHPINYAIFDIGPGTLEDRVQAQDLLDNLTMSGTEATGNRIEFLVVESPFGLYVLGKITGFGHGLDSRISRTGRLDNPLSNLVFEFIRPQNGRETAQRELIRQNIGWREERPQPHVDFDLDLEQAMLADIEEMHQNRLPRVEAAAQDQEDARRHRMELVDGLVRMTPEERQRQDGRIDRRRREMAQERRAQAAALAAEAEIEAIFGPSTLR